MPPLDVVNLATLSITASSVTKLKKDGGEVEVDEVEDAMGATGAGALAAMTGAVGLALGVLLPQSPANGE